MILAESEVTGNVLTQNTGQVDLYCITCLTVIDVTWFLSLNIS